MILAALALPYPGKDSIRAETRIRSAIGSLESRTSLRATSPFLTFSRSSARAWRASAAFSSAALRCSGVRLGSAIIPPNIGTFWLSTQTIFCAVRTINELVCQTSAVLQGGTEHFPLKRHYFCTFYTQTQSLNTKSIIFTCIFVKF